MFKNKGFTLVELLGVLGLVGVMLLITIPSIVKLMENNEKNKNERFLKDLYNATEVYVESNRNLFPTLNVEGGKASVSVLTLIDNDYIKGSLIDPKTDKKINNDDAIVVDVNTNKTFKYTFIRVGENEYNGPRIIVQDDDFEIIEGTSYNLLNGVVALGRSNEVLPVEVNIKDTSKLLIGEHEVIFSATDDEGRKTEVKKKLVVLKQYNYVYTGNSQTFVTPISGNYKIELWGAQGGYNSASLGAYTAGEIYLELGTTLYVYVGQGLNPTVNGTSFNGGTADNSGYPGGGATDVRLTSGSWNGSISLRSRIMVAGGSGSGYNTINTGYGGALAGGNGPYATGGSQITFGSKQESHYANSSFGIGNGGCAGGGGYYGGGGSTCVNGGGGGSSYISGHKGCIAIKSSTDQTPKAPTYSKIEDSYHYSNKVFTNTVMRTGNETMPTYDSKTTMIGNKGNGYAKITYIGK